jgi:hypothetical protein
MTRVAITSLLVVLLSSVIQVSVAKQGDGGVLARITKIYIESAPNTQADPHKDALTRELTKAGFGIVGDRLKADAILTVFAQVQVVIDGDGSVPNKSIFTYELVLADKTVVWKYRISIIMRTLGDDINRGAAKMAIKLLKNKQDSVRKGAHK